MSQVAALFLSLKTIRSLNATKASLVNNTSKQKSNNKKGSMNEQKKNDAEKCAYLLRTTKKRKNQ